MNMSSGRNEYVSYARKAVSDLFAKKRLIVSYAREESRTRGAVVAVLDKGSDTILYGWSLCNPKDRYNKHVGILKAVVRASDENSIGQWPPIARERLATAIVRAKDNAMRYFK